MSKIDFTSSVTVDPEAEHFEFEPQLNCRRPPRLKVSVINVTSRIVEDNATSPYDNLAASRWAEEVRRLLGTLTPIESRIIRWRFGLDNEDELTLKAIGDKYNLSRGRIRQLQEQAIGKIRKQIRDT